MRDRKLTPRRKHRWIPRRCDPVHGRPRTHDCLASGRGRDRRAVHRGGVEPHWLAAGHCDHGVQPCDAQCLLDGRGGFGRGRPVCAAVPRSQVSRRAGSDPAAVIADGQHQGQELQALEARAVVAGATSLYRLCIMYNVTSPCGRVQLAALRWSDGIERSDGIES